MAPGKGGYLYVEGLLSAPLLYAPELWNKGGLFLQIPQCMCDNEQPLFSLSLSTYVWPQMFIEFLYTSQLNEWGFVLFFEVTN